MTKPGKIINIGNPLCKWNQTHFPTDLGSAIAEFKQQDSFKQLSAFIDSGPNPGDVLRIKASSTPNNYVDENYCDDYIATLICVSEKSVSEQPTLSIADTLRQEVNSDFIHSIDYSYILQCIKDLSRIQSTVTLEKYKMLEVYLCLCQLQECLQCRNKRHDLECNSKVSKETD